MQRIHETLKAKGDDALLVSELAEAARHRILAFEILPASFVVAHLQVGLLLQKLGAPLSEKKDERLGIYLTNALTGWELRDQPPLGWPEMEAEREGAGKVKREKPILVVLGNPPYNAFAGISPAEEEGLVEPYKRGLISEWKIKKFNLDDLYVRFFRLAERRIAEMTGRGVICYISNFSYLSDPSFVVMRQRFVGEFERLWFDCMNGDSRETGKLTPDGKPDPSVFSTQYNREGIRKGTAIGLMVRGQSPKKPAEIMFRHFWGVTKRADLVQSLDVKDFDAQYGRVQPERSNRFSFRPQAVTAEYMTWPKLDALSALGPSLGILENRQEVLITIDRSPLEERMKAYFDEAVDWDGLQSLYPALTKDFARFDAKATRKKLLASGVFSPVDVRRLLLRPMDFRWCYYTSARPLWNEPRPDYVEQMWPGNRALVSRRKGVASREGAPFFLTSSIGYQHALQTDAYFFPLRLKAIPKRPKDRKQGQILTEEKGKVNAISANLSQSVLNYLMSIGLERLGADEQSAASIWMHTLAIGYSPSYLSENADGIRRDWPRIPLPGSMELLLASAALGDRVGNLIDTESAVAGVTAGELRSELRMMALPSRTQGGALRDDELAIDSGWGHLGKDGVTMPGQGESHERDYTVKELEAISHGVTSLGLSVELALEILGDKTLDIYLNDAAYWSNIPGKVWDYTIGGFAVLKKWLSYRESKLLGRALTKDEIRYFQEMVRRIAALLLLEPSLNTNYQAVKYNTYPWPNT